MTTVSLKYNPYLIRTEILVDGKKPKENSALIVGKRRLQEWIDKLPHNLHEEFLEDEFIIEYTGTADDFRDVEEAFSRHKYKTTFKTSFTPPVDDVEKEVHAIFYDIQNGPIDELRDPKIIAAFNKAENQEFEVNVVATMSAGKSTLINALLSNQLMPAKKEATTATIVRIKDSDSPSFSAQAFDNEDHLVAEYKDVSLQQMRDLNDNKNISVINLTGSIPFLNNCNKSAGRVRLVLVDTPGPNNSNDANHKVTTYNMLRNSDKSLVLYVVNSDQFGINDDATFLDDVCKEMGKCGKQSKERFIFAVNKLDETNPDEYDSDNCIIDNLTKVKSYIEKRDVKDPNIFPVSAIVALSARRGQDASNPFAKWPKFVEQYKAMDIFKFEQYYDFSHLPVKIQEQNEKTLKDCKLEEEVAIHSGIREIEQAIELYINKYSRTTKVYDLTRSFNDRLKEVSAFENLSLSLSKSKEDKKDVVDEIMKIRHNISKAKDATAFAGTLNELCSKVSKDNTTEVEKIVDPLKKKINSLIMSGNKVPKNEAMAKCKTIQSSCDSVASQLISEVNGLLDEKFKAIVAESIDKYKSYLSALNISGGDVLRINPIELVAGEFENIKDLVKDNTITEHHSHTEQKTEQVYEKSNRHWYNLWRLGFGHGDRYVERTREVVVNTTEEFVDMRSVSEDFFEPYWSYIDETQNKAVNYMDSEIKRLVGLIQNKTSKIDEILTKKLDELDSAETKEKDIEAIIKQKENNLKWLTSIQNRVNNLISF